MTEVAPPQEEEAFVSVMLHMWRNGGRPLVIAVLLLVSSLILLASVYLFYLFKAPAETIPIRFLIPQPLIGADTYKPGDKFETRRTRCNDSENALTIQGTSWYHRLDSTADKRIPYSSGEAVVPGKGKDNPDGCETSRLTNTLPADIPAGLWRLEGTTCLKSKPQLCTSWTTEQFRVVVP